MLHCANGVEWISGVLFNSKSRCWGPTPHKTLNPRSKIRMMLAIHLYFYRKEISYYLVRQAIMKKKINYLRIIIIFSRDFNNFADKNPKLTCSLLSKSSPKIQRHRSVKRKWKLLSEDDTSSSLSVNSHWLTFLSATSQWLTPLSASSHWLTSSISSHW